MTAEQNAGRAAPLKRSQALVLIVVATVALFAFVEGMASIWWVMLRVFDPPAQVAERVHTRYDRDLGWSNVQNTFIRDMYGRGVDLRINRQGFRGVRDVLGAVAGGKLRAVCSGDSFTFGYGVRDDRTWCARLATHNPRLETVNMGQGGYGVDQAYLWYRRDAAQLAHGIHLFAFVDTDFDRMARTEFVGYPKPRLVVDGDQLRVTNVPVPEPSGRGPERPSSLRELRLFQMLGARPTGDERHAEPPAELVRVADKVFEALARLHRERGAAGVVVFLPRVEDYRESPADAWRRHVLDSTRRHGLAYVDLIDEFRRLPADEVNGMFIPEGALSYAHAEGHYTAYGNDVIARLLYGRLMQIDGVRTLLVSP